MYSGSVTHIENCIVTCPDDYPDLPIRRGLPLLALDTRTPVPGSTVQLQLEKLDCDGPVKVAWLSGPAVYYTDIGDNWVTTVPQDLQGIAYAAVVSDTSGDDMDSSLCTGIAVVDCVFSSYVPNPGPEF